MDVRQQFGRLLREHRTRKGFTQEELAFRAGMNVTYLSDIERGKSAPSLSLLVDLAIALDAQPADLLVGLALEKLSRDGGRKRPRDT